MNKTKFACQLLFCTILFTLVCCKDHEKIKQTVEPEKNSKKLFTDSVLTVKKFFKSKKWVFPVEIGFDKNADKKFLLEAIDKPLFKQKIALWLKDSCYEYKRNKAVRVSNIVVARTAHQEEIHTITCIIEFYKPGEFVNGLIMPIEGRGVIGGAIYVQREKAFFLWKEGSLNFLKWNN